MNQPPPLSAILETCLYVTDLTRARTFYETLFGYSVMAADDRFCAFEAGERQVLLLFLYRSDPHGSVMPLWTIPPHDCSRSAPICFWTSFQRPSTSRTRPGAYRG